MTMTRDLPYQGALAANPYGISLWLRGRIRFVSSVRRGVVSIGKRSGNRALVPIYR